MTEHSISLENVISMIEKLVSFDTVSYHSNLQLIEFVSEYLNQHGIKSHLVFNSEQNKANLYASLGPASKDGVILSGHTDVVPVTGQNWTTDPFILSRQDQRLYGRGSADMKSFIAIALALVPEMLAANMNKPIHFAFSYDEEIGCCGAPSMISELVKKLPPINAVIVGEPTSMQIANLHKGIHSLITRVKGVAAHSSLVNQGCNAIAITAKLIDFLQSQQQHFIQHKQTEIELEPNYSTINLGIIQGGQAVNIVANECELRWDLRVMPKDKPEELLAKFNAFSQQLEAQLRVDFPSVSISTEIFSQVPALKTENNSNAEELCRHLTGRNHSIAVAYATEAGQFQNAGYSTVVCGPGSIEQAHKPDEYISIEQVQAGIDFMRRLIQWQAN